MITQKEAELLSQPYLSGFNPYVIPYQGEVLGLIRQEYDYNQGLLEVLLSGSVGCLREDALIETACGAIPICDITSRDYVLSFSHSQNRFVFQSNSGAFLKDKGSLYRVITKHGEFVASEHHHIATSDGNYLSVQKLLDHGTENLTFLSHEKKRHVSCQLWLLSDVLDSMKTISSFLYHCAKHIHQCDPQLLSDLNIFLGAFPLQIDVQAVSQFSYQATSEQKGVLLELVSRLSHRVEAFSQTDMQNFSLPLGSKTLDEVDVYFSTTPYGQICKDIQSLQQYHLHNVRPITLLFFLAKFGIVLSNILEPYTCEYTNTPIEAIEKIGVDWYWDLQVPNTNNYISHGLVHHNSSKSILMAHIGVTHCLMYPGARLGLGRKAMPDLKSTIFQKIIEHIETDLTEGKDYTVNNTNASIDFSNGSQIISRSWSDKKYKKLRSLELSALIIEELTENDDEDKQAYTEFMMRVGRIPHIKERFVISASNPDSPSHWAYKHFILGEKETRRVFYSVTSDNPFLDPTYINRLLEDLDPKMAQRMVYGKWIEISGEVIYYNYSRENNFVDSHYTVNEKFPIHFSYDFNIGEGKPMSVIFYQIIDDVFHFFDEIVIHGSRTLNTLDEAADRGIFDYPVKYFCHGDASGANRDTRNNLSDYQIIDQFMNRYQNKSGQSLDYQRQVLGSNPPVRKRHNLVNAYCRNELGQVRFKLYKKCKVADEGMRLTKLKKGADYIEDDSKEYQHITTAIGYGIYHHSINRDRKTTGMVQL